MNTAVNICHKNPSKDWKRTKKMKQGEKYVETQEESVLPNN
jgi:hypothetical protein